MNEITTITFLKFAGFKNKKWAFTMMNKAHKGLAQVPGQIFYKLMGSGRGHGFNPLPDWSTYTLLQVWENEEQASQFLAQSNLMEQYKMHTLRHWSLFMKTVMAKGQWSGQNPFRKSKSLSAEIPYIGVITRATIKPRQLLNFWRYVPNSMKPLYQNPGLLFTKGIGEVPILQMATFSLWQNKEALMQFAYHSKAHRTAIEKTRTLNWYSEELFARFQLYRYEGDWDGLSINLAKNPG
ncbi:MAG: DUF3291 domain-containing protein [Bacteroidota bacterium]